MAHIWIHSKQYHQPKKALSGNQGDFTWTDVFPAEVLLKSFPAHQFHANWQHKQMKKRYRTCQDIMLAVCMTIQTTHAGIRINFNPHTFPRHSLPFAWLFCRHAMLNNDGQENNKMILLLWQNICSLSLLSINATIIWCTKSTLL